jgi:preprotein translocase subunit SecD
VAIGFTADSFIVYFERIRDEMRDGRSMTMAVERGWKRAKRTVLAAKSVTLISAVVLYFLAVGGVQGFAFTLGLTTVIDIAVVFWFTHPTLQMLTKVPFFRDGHSWSGLSPERLRTTSGPRYVGAGRVETPAAAGADVTAPEPVLAGASVARPADGGQRMTIAERRAAERRAAAAEQDDQAGTKDAGSGENEESR